MMHGKLLLICRKSMTHELLKLMVDKQIWGNKVHCYTRYF